MARHDMLLGGTKTTCTQQWAPMMNRDLLICVLKVSTISTIVEDKFIFGFYYLIITGTSTIVLLY